MQKKSFPWGLIVLMFFLFFPIGIWMLVRKMTDERFNYVKNGQSLQVFGWVLIAFGLIYLIMGVTGELQTEDGTNAVGAILVMLLIFVGGGIFSLCKAASYIKKGTKYSRYVAIINAGNDVLIDNIAAAYPTTYEKALQDIQEMINDGYFMHAYVDLNRRELIIPYQSAASAPMNPHAASVKGQPQSVKCKNCGAPNTKIPGAVNECEYCGSPL